MLMINDHKKIYDHLLGFACGPRAIKMDLDNMKMTLIRITEPTIWHTVTFVGTLHLFGIRSICQASTNLDQCGKS